MVTAKNQAAPSGSPQEPVSQIVRLLGQLKAQPGKTAATGLLVCVLIVLLLRAVTGPKAASAVQASPLVPQADAKQETPAAPAAGCLDVTIPAIPPIQVPAVSRLPLPRDVFAVDWRRFPKVGGKSPEEQVEARQVEQARKTQSSLDELKRQVAAFHLEGTVTGAACTAFIDGSNIREGQEHRGFRLVRVLDQAVVLERDGVRLELRMPEY